MALIQTMHFSSLDETQILNTFSTRLRTHLEKRRGGHLKLQSEHFLDDERLAVNQLGLLAALVLLGPAHELKNKNHKSTTREIFTEH
jgi:hypothetical protein